MYNVRVGDTPHNFEEVTADDRERRRVRIVACSCGVGGVRIGRAPTITISGKFSSQDVFNCPSSIEIHVIKMISEKKKYISSGMVRNSIQEIVPAPAGKDDQCYWVSTENGLVKVDFSEAVPVIKIDKIKRIKILNGSTYGSRQNLTHGSVHDVISPPKGETNESGLWVEGVDAPVLVQFGCFAKAWRAGNE